jgi:hypothetical protein
MTPETDDALWLSKPEAAQLLGTSVRNVERRAFSGYVRKRSLPRAPGETTARVVYNRADLLALKLGRPNEYGVPNEKPTDAAASKSEAVISIPAAPVESDASKIRELELWAAKDEALMCAQDRVIESLDASLKRAWEAERVLRAALATPPAPAVPRVWLNLQEAAAASGLPAAWLLANVEYVQALDLGRSGRKGGRWRFRLADLERIGR